MSDGDFSRHYDNVFFEEYLDGGNKDIAFYDTSVFSDTNKNTHKNTPKYTQTVNSKRTLTKRANHTDTDIHSVKQIARQQTRKIQVKNKHDQTLYLATLSSVCVDLLGQAAIDIDFPGGFLRSSCRLMLEDHTTVVVTRRAEPMRARYEKDILQLLATHHAPVPHCLAFNGLVLIQEDLQGRRLADVLKDADEKTVKKGLEQAIQSLITVYQVAEETGLDHAVPIVGCHHDWLISFLDRTAILGNHLNIPCPPLPVRQMHMLLTLFKPRFVKWDARPGNAMVNDAGKVFWFDWEHSCARNRLDDLAWLICDDTVPEYPAVEEQLIDQYLMDFADGKNFLEAYDYLRIFGIHHMCVRITRLLNLKENDTWSYVDMEYKNGEIGLALKEAQRLCERASRWSSTTPYTLALSDWFLKVRTKLVEL